MFGALTSLTGGGGMSASSSASNDSKNDISTGTISVGGLNMSPKSSGLDSDLIIKGGAVIALGLAAVWAFKKL